MRIVGLVQARMGSSRLPGKVLKPLCGRPLVGHIFDRLRATPGVADVILATTMDPRNDALAAFSERENVRVFRATAEDDIAARLAGACRISGADAVLKVNGDCPLVDPAILRLLVARFEIGDVDYVSNKVRWTWPEGMSAEVIGAKAIYACDEQLTGARERELVANHTRDCGEFRVASVEGDKDLTHHKWSVDTLTDFEEVSRIFEACYPRNKLFGIDDVLGFVAGERAPNE